MDPIMRLCGVAVSVCRWSSGASKRSRAVAVPSQGGEDRVTRSLAVARRPHLNQGEATCAAVAHTNRSPAGSTHAQTPSSSTCSPSSLRPEKSWWIETWNLKLTNRAIAAALQRAAARAPRPAMRSSPARSSSSPSGRTRCSSARSCP